MKKSILMIILIMTVTLMLAGCLLEGSLFLFEG